MKSITNKLKQIGRMYVAPVALAGAVAFGSYGCKEEKAVELPISQEVKNLENIRYESKQKQIDTKLENMSNSYNTTLNSARKKFNEYIAQEDTFTVNEQEQTFALYEQANELLENIKNYAKDHKRAEYSSLKLPKKDAELSSLLKENLYGRDYGTPELEKALKSSGINIEVQPIKSEVENKLANFGMFIFGGVLPFGILLSYVIQRDLKT